mgnify:CR=1 FL=1
MLATASVTAASASCIARSAALAAEWEACTLARMASTDGLPGGGVAGSGDGGCSSAVDAVCAGVVTVSMRGSLSSHLANDNVSIGMRKVTKVIVCPGQVLLPQAVATEVALQSELAAQACRKMVGMVRWHARRISSSENATSQNITYYGD